MNTEGMEDNLNLTCHCMQDVQSSKTTFINKTQQCFAVRSGVDGILDLARSTFCRVTEQVHELVDKYKTEHGFDALKVSCMLLLLRTKC